MSQVGRLATYRKFQGPLNFFLKPGPSLIPGFAHPLHNQPILLETHHLASSGAAAASRTLHRYAKEVAEPLRVVIVDDLGFDVLA